MLMFLNLGWLILLNSVFGLEITSYFTSTTGILYLLKSKVYFSRSMLGWIYFKILGKQSLWQSWFLSSDLCGKLKAISTFNSSCSWSPYCFSLSLLSSNEGNPTITAFKNIPFSYFGLGAELRSIPLSIDSLIYPNSPFSGITTFRNCWLTLKILTVTTMYFLRVSGVYFKRL